MSEAQARARTKCALREVGPTSRCTHSTSGWFSTVEDQCRAQRSAQGAPLAHPAADHSKTQTRARTRCALRGREDEPPSGSSSCYEGADRQTLSSAPSSLSTVYSRQGRSRHEPRIVRSTGPSARKMRPQGGRADTPLSTQHVGKVQHSQGPVPNTMVSARCTAGTPSRRPQPGISPFPLGWPRRPSPWNPAALNSRERSTEPL